MTATTKVISKREFNRLQVDSLFTKGGTLTENKDLPYCAGKYTKSIIGREVRLLGDCKVIFAVAKRDKDGTYYQLRCAK